VEMAVEDEVMFTLSLAALQTDCLCTTRCRKSLHPTLVTTYELIQNEYSRRIQNVVTMDDLF